MTTSCHPNLDGVLLTNTFSFSKLIESIEVSSSEAATFFKRFRISVQAIRVAFPFRSAVALAAEGEVLATLKVLVVWIFILDAGNENVSAATWAIFVFTP